MSDFVALIEIGPRRVTGITSKTDIQYNVYIYVICCFIIISHIIQKIDPCKIITEINHMGNEYFIKILQTLVGSPNFSIELTCDFTKVD